jgi:hypothetical protein
LRLLEDRAARRRGPAGRTVRESLACRRNLFTRAIHGPRPTRPPAAVQNGGAVLLRASHAEIAKTEGAVVIAVFSQQSDALRVGREEFSAGFEGYVAMARFVVDDLRVAVGDQLFGLGFGEERHVEVPHVSGPAGELNDIRRDQANSHR